MNVVGKVGSFITQGVYSVATPFHPFGGAVDIIVVQQQDGSFRSTPWYVQFGKFQGVLKGAEKMVRINVNGVEADFHMFLDNSGEAYFVREADSCQDVERNEVSTDEREGALEHSLSVDNSECNINNDHVANYRLQSTLSDPGVLRDDFSSFRADHLDRTDSDACRFYDFQDDQSFEGELSPDFGSGRYDNMEAVENFVEAQGSDSEMVLVSVDGHILTAPISLSEPNTENLQLATPQFHLGPGESDGFCEGDGEFTVSGSTWDSEFITDLGASSKRVTPVTSSENNTICTHESVSGKGKGEGPALEILVKDDLNQLEILPGEGTHDMHTSESYNEGDENVVTTSVQKNCHENGDNDWQGEEHEVMCSMDPIEQYGKHAREENGVQNIHSNGQSEGEKEHTQLDDNNVCLKIQNPDLNVPSDVEDISPSVKNERFKSCLDLTITAGDESSEEESSTNTVTEVTDLEEKNFEISKVTEISSPEIGGLVDERVSDVNLGGIPEIKVSTDGESSPVASDSFADSFVATLSNPADESIKSAEDIDLECTLTEDTAEGSAERDFAGTGSDRSEVLHSQRSCVSEQGQAISSPMLEISLCRHLLHPGMGLDAAKEAFKSHQISDEEYKNTAVSAVRNENLVIRYKEKYLPWDQAAPIVLGIAAFGLDLSIDSKDIIPVEQEAIAKPAENDSGSSSLRRWRLWPIAFRKVKTIPHSNSSSSEEVFVDPESVMQNPSSHQTPTSEIGTPRSVTSLKSPLKKIVRTNIPTNEQIESLNLKEGQNDVTFSFSTRVLGVQQVEAHIYLWKWNARIVISDVDGTITKSDVLGQFMPLVGKDWSQSGVARLFTAIKENGYQLLFLSARAIVQAYLTKSFLFNLKQDGKSLPNGPVVISPNGLFPSLFREVIRRAPHEFKIACLEDIKALFPADYNPFYAGFGNRDTDELTYRKIGIPKGKIFIINPKGEVAINHRIDVKSYTSLHTLVNDMFPPTSMAEQEDYNHWNYWKMPLPDIDD